MRSPISLSPVDQYYEGQTAEFPMVTQDGERSLAVMPHVPEEEDILERAHEAQWRILSDPHTTRQFDVLIFNPKARSRGVLIPPTAGGYHPGHMYEGALWAAQNPRQQLVLLPSFSLEKAELRYYAQHGRLTTDGDNGEVRPLPSIVQLARAVIHERLAVTDLYGRSAGTKEAGILPALLPSVSNTVLGSPPQLTRRSVLSFTRSALAMNNQRRLVESGYAAKDEFQVNTQWVDKVATARGGQLERPQQTGRFAARVGNYAIRAAHAAALAKGPEAFLADLDSLGNWRVSLVVYTKDELYSTELQAALGRVMTAFASRNPEARMRTVLVRGGHRLPERYPCLTNDMTDALIER